MTWDNYGKYWHIDHIYPCAHYDMDDKEQQYECFNWTNTFPLEGRENISKNDYIDLEYVEHCEKRYKLFMKKFGECK